ncbi:MAG: nucleotidyltransferase family protein [Clostridia bacterium]|nr:nucleotidyltransferase family protein [Clostridia bacterium]
MKTYGIIAEFNPIHTGHKYLIDYAKRHGDKVIVAMSGNFVQRGALAIYKKYDRAKSALLCGADIVAEIPAVYSLSVAGNFALCGVSTLYNLGADTIVFGSETGDIKALQKTADILMSESFKKTLVTLKDDNSTFAVKREKAAVICGADKQTLKNPNDNLGIEYIIAAKTLGLDLSFEAVKREGAKHTGTLSKGYASSNYLRELIYSGNIKTAKEYIPKEAEFLLLTPAADLKCGEKALLALLREKTGEDFALLPDLSEGIENRLIKAIKTAKSIDELLENVKTKRYTLARIRRLVFNAALGFDNSFFLKVPPYTRVLGSRKGVKIESRLYPLLSKVSDINNLGEEAKKLFDFECKAADIYGLFFEDALPSGSELEAKYIKI